MKNIFKMLLTFLILINVSISAQADEYPVEYYEMKGELTSRDLFKNEFGRYDGFELPLSKDENAYFFVYSTEFSPSLILVSPEGKVFQQSNAQGGEFSTIRTSIPQTGNWYVYVVGNAEDEGVYYFHYGFAGKNAIKLSKEADFCSKLNYLIAHSKAHFVFLENPDLKIELPQFENSTDATINGDDASYNTVIYDGTSFNKAIKIFTDFNKEVKSCLGDDWKTQFNDFVDVGDHREQSIEYTLKNDDQTKMIQLILADFRKTSERFFNDFAVVVVINSI
jgi:hypothetical protein